MAIVTGTAAAASSGASAGADVSIESAYSWRVAGLTLLVTSLSFGAVTAVPILLNPMARDWQVSNGTLALVHMSTMFGAALGSLVLGRLLDRRGFFHIALAGGIATMLGLILASTATSLVTLHIAFGVLVGGIGQGAFFSPIAAVLSQWFDRNRALAIAISVSGQSIGGLILPPLLRWGGSVAGWRTTLLVYGIACGVILVACAFVFRRTPPPGNELSGPLMQQAASLACPRHQFLSLAICITAINFSSFMVIGHLTAYGEERGFMPLASAFLVSAMLGVALVSRLAVGPLSKRLGKYNVLLCVSALQLLGVACLVWTKGYVAVMLSAVLVGLGFGGYVPLYAVLVREMFHASEAGRRISEIYFFAFIAAGLGSSLGGWLRDQGGHYGLTFQTATGLSAFGMLILVSRRKSLAAG